MHTRCVWVNQKHFVACPRGVIGIRQIALEATFDYCIYDEELPCDSQCTEITAKPLALLI